MVQYGAGPVETSQVEPVVEFGEVLAAARAGEDWAVAVLYRDLHPRLRGYFGARAGGAAEDLESEVWLAVAQRLHAFEGDEIAFRAWVFSIARRRLADLRRTLARRRTDVAPVEDLDRPDAAADPQAIVLEAMDGDAAVAFVRRWLPHDHAEIVLLRVVAGLDVDQVAALVRKRPGTVRVIQHRALRRLERILGEKRVTR